MFSEDQWVPVGQAPTPPETDFEVMFLRDCEDL